MLVQSSRILRLTLCIMACLASVISAQAQEASFAPNPRVDSVFAQYDRQDSPGCVVGVYRDGRIAYARGYGMADLERRIPLTARSVLDIASVGKQFTAAITVLLTRQGKLSLDDDVRKYIPELPDYGHRITLRHLLNHTSGIRDYNGLLSLSGFSRDDVTTKEDALSAIARQKALNFQPGGEYLYSNSGYFLLSLVVERVTGKSLRDFAREQIFQPLGMTRTDYMGSYNDVVADRAIGYSPRDGTGFRSDMPRWLQIGDGGIWTTVEDLLLWDRNFSDPKVGGRAMIDTLQTPGRLANGNRTGYALGLSIDSYLGQRKIGHSGRWGGYSSELTRYPDHRLSVAVLCNTSAANTGQLSARVANIYLTSVITAPPSLANANSSLPPVPIAENALPRFSGTFRHPSLPEMRTVVDGGKFFLAVAGDRFELRHVGSHKFAILGAPADASITFDAPASVPSPSFRFQITGEEPMILTRTEVVTVTAAELQAYAGRFFSEELRATYEIVASDGGIALTARGLPPGLYRPGLRDEFRTGSTTLRFTRGPKGEVSGFFLDQIRSRNLRFDKVPAAAPIQPCRCG